MVDASQGVEAQTLANSYLAINHGLEIVPVINKIDLQSADIERTKEMIEGAVGLDASNALLISAKTGQGVPDVLEAIVKRVPPPKGSRSGISRRCSLIPGLILIAAWWCWRAFFKAGCTRARRFACGRTARLFRWRHWVC